MVTRKDFWTETLARLNLESPGYHEAAREAAEYSRQKREEKDQKTTKTKKSKK